MNEIENAIPNEPLMTPVTPIAKMTKLTEGNHPCTVLGAIATIQYGRPVIEIDVQIHSGIRHQHYVPIHDQGWRESAAKNLNKAFGTAFTDQKTSYTKEELAKMEGKTCSLKAEEETWIDKNTGLKRAAIKTKWLNPYSKIELDLNAPDEAPVEKKTKEVVF